MEFLRSYKKEIILGVVLFGVPFLIPPFGVSADVGSLVSAASTVFAIVAGFFIVDATSNYLRLQTLIAEENAALIGIADNAQQLDTKHSVGVHEAIDAYLISQLDGGTLDHFSKTQTQIDQLDASIHALAVRSESSMLYDHILTLEEKIIACRQEMTLAAKRTLSLVHWLTLIVLAALVVMTVLAIRDGTWPMHVVAGALMLGMFAVLIVLRDIDNNRLLERKLAYRNPTQVFHAIAKPPYYPYASPVKARIPNQDGQLRVGRKSESA